MKSIGLYISDGISIVAMKQHTARGNYDYRSIHAYRLFVVNHGYDSDKHSYHWLLNPKTGFRI